jgi:hypothetical protein
MEYLPALVRFENLARATPRSPSRTRCVAIVWVPFRSVNAAFPVGARPKRDDTFTVPVACALAGE